jgi:SAM-dependent methyltransferase
MHPQIYEDIYNAELTHWWFCGRLHIVTSLLRRFAPKSRPLRVADVGCGMGASLEALGEFGWVAGLDYSATALGFSRQRGFLRLLAAALPSLPFPDAEFDIVCALDVIEHIDDDAAAVRELWRVCKPGGLLVVTVPAYEWLWSEHDDINEHKRRYTRPLLRKRLTLPGSELVRLSYMNTLFAPPAMLFRLLRNLGGKKKSAASDMKSDVFPLPRPLNAIFKFLFSSENIWLRYAPLPFGISLICILRKHES